MNILIGENIKALRLKKGVTQEQLGEAFNISAAAVSKWERGDTLPDISLLPQLAFFFHVSIDELMGYNEGRVEREIEEIIAEHTREAQRYNNRKCLEISTAAYKAYPNDYRVMELYMWDLIGGYADNDPAAIVKHQEKLLGICERILEGCTDTYIRLDAIVMKGKVLHANGRTKEAVELYREKLPDWFQTSGQKCEQLFDKDSPEFAELLKKNISELVNFVLNKKSKEIWFDKSKTTAEKVETAIGICEAMRAFEPYARAEDLDRAVSYFASDFESKLKYSGADEETVARVHGYIL